MKPFSPSPLQSSIFSHLLSPSTSNLIVNAVAGSGKTTTIVEALKLILSIPRTTLLPPAILFLAFNKSIAETLSARCPRGANCSTFHSLGFRALKQLLPKVKLETRKVSKLVYARMDREDPDIQSVCRLVGLMKSQWPRIETLSQVSSLATQYEISVESSSVRHALDVFNASALDHSTIDFDDMLFLPVLLNAPFDQQDWVFVDESQDTNDIQVEILSRLDKGFGREMQATIDAARTIPNPFPCILSPQPRSVFVFVGDPNQAIYAFRGANADAMEKIRKRFACIEQPLDVSYRCPKAVVREAQKCFI